MNHDEVQWLAARCLTDPLFLDRALALARSGQEPVALPGLGERETKAAAAVFGGDELERLALFRGFITKVKHNGIRRTVPCTFRLLEFLGVDLGFFVGFAAVYFEARAGGPLSTDRHLELLEEHLLPFLDRLPTLDRELVRDVFTHESSLSQAGHTPDVVAVPVVNGAVTWRGRLIIRRYSTDVQAACLALAEFPYRGGSHALATDRPVGYWRSYGSREVTVFEMDELTALLLSKVDNASTVPQIAASLASQGLEQLTTPALEDFYADAAGRGWVAWAGDGSAGKRIQSVREAAS